MPEEPNTNIEPVQGAELSGTSTPLGQNSGAKRIFIGPYGLRAGWRLAIFIIVLVVLFFILGALARAFGVRGGGLPTFLTPARLSGSEATMFLLVYIASWIMARIEKRKIAQYGLPWNQALRKDFWRGLLWGFVATSASLGAIFLLHGVRLTHGTIHGEEVLTSTAAWTVTFLIVGLSEEFAFRGYVQFTLSTGIGFWPAAIVLSALFGLAHAGNPGENVSGELSVVCFGLLFCLFLRRTGNLWWPVGFHMGYDWGQTFFYGVPDSGMLPYHNFLSSSFSGPRWLTGGTVGPEASVFTPITLAIVAILFSRVYRENQYRTVIASEARTPATVAPVAAP
jgi:uncharacterized protein